MTANTKPPPAAALDLSEGADAVSADEAAPTTLTLRALYVSLPAGSLYPASRVSVRGPHGPLDPDRADEVRRGLVRDLAALAVALAAEGKLP